MGKTRRNCQPGWNPDHPGWPQLLPPNISPTDRKKWEWKGENYQSRDRPPYGNKEQRFSKHGKNSRHNLRRKGDDLDERVEKSLPLDDE